MQNLYSFVFVTTTTSDVPEIVYLQYADGFPLHLAKPKPLTIKKLKIHSV